MSQYVFDIFVLIFIFFLIQVNDKDQVFDEGTSTICGWGTRTDIDYLTSNGILSSLNPYLPLYLSHFSMIECALI